MLLFLLTCTIIHVLHSLYARNRKPNYKLPPGPSLVTIMGNLLELCKRPHQTLAKFSNIYGPIMTLKIGQASTTTIIISSVHLAKEILQTHDILFSDRTIPDITTAYNHNHFSLVFLPVSPLWQDLRKICHNHLFASKTLDASQDLRRKKLQELLNDMHQSSLTGETVDIGRAAFKTCINFLSHTFVSQDFVLSLDDEYKNIVASLLKATGTPNLVDFFPVLKMVDPQGVRRDTTNYLTKLFHVLDSLIDERMRLREGKHYVTNNDMLDTLLDISQENIHKMDKKKIRHLLLDVAFDVGIVGQLF
ncbi:Cytochrome P450 [Sesbania bispinosa]|nr:Cytochrome P450 [Sesbania bispinosa]